MENLLLNTEDVVQPLDAQKSFEQLSDSYRSADESVGKLESRKPVKKKPHQNESEQNAEQEM